MDINNTEDLRLMPDVDEVWNICKKNLINKIKTPVFESFVKPIVPVLFENNELILAVNSEFVKSMLTNYLGIIHESVKTVLNPDVKIKIIIDTSIKIDDATILSVNSQTSKDFENTKPSKINYHNSNLNEKYTFSNFVVGSNNQFCHSAALAISEKPGLAYNPLFIYGGVGLGKTHLMHAIGNEILKNYNNLNVKYISCEKFTNDMITSIKNDKMPDFRKRYRQIDVLLIDDIQFIQGKESTQEEFFHTFNTLKDNGKQIIISSDRPPKNINLLEERLRSRFEWGLIADIQPANLETRLAILSKKCEDENLVLSNEIMLYLANSFTTNIRELEGALNQIRAFNSLTKEPITVELLSSKIFIQNKPKVKKIISLDKVLSCVAKHFNIEISEIISNKRTADLALPRHISMYLAHELLKLSFTRIGDEFCNRKHSSVLYAYNKIKETIDSDQNLKSTIQQIIDKIES